MKKLIGFTLVIWIMSLYMGILHLDSNDFGHLYLERPWYSVIFFAGYFVAILLEIHFKETYLQFKDLNNG